MDQKQMIELVKKLREELGLSIMEIKSALVEAGGNENKAKEILKARGFEKAEKRAERATAQGRVATYTHSTGKLGSVAELLCETDFVARHEDFVNLSKDLCLHVAAMNPSSTEEMLKQPFVKDGSTTPEELIKALVMKFGENIQLGRVARFEIEAPIAKEGDSC